MRSKLRMVVRCALVVGVIFAFAPAIIGQSRADRAVNLEVLNSPASEVAPIITADGNTVYFTSDRAEGLGGQDFWTSRRVGGKWSKPVNIAELNTSQNEGPDTITSDGRTMYYTACNRREDGTDKCDIYVTHLGPDGKWVPGENLGPPVNTDYEEANATINPDGRMLVFTSNRPGGMGTYDLWMSTRNQDGTWSDPKNMGPSINTSMWEGVAFFHSDGVTLYFSSNGHGGFGNADIFQSQLQPDGTWSEPINMGGLINSAYNDIYFSVPAAGDMAYFSSSNEGGFGREDIYAIPKEIIFKSRDYVVVRGRVTDAATKKPVAAMVTVSGGTEGSQQTTSNPRSGNYHLRLKIGSVYNINAGARGYMDSMSSIDLSVADPFRIVVHNITLRPVVATSEAAPTIEETALPEDAEEILIDGGRLVVRDVLFGFDKHTLRPTAIPVLERLITFLEQNPGVRIKVDGYTDSVGAAGYNLKLSIRRAQSVKKYMVLRGISSSRVVTQGHGERNLIATDDPKTGNIKNRRVEFSLVRGTYSPTRHPETSMRGKQPPENVIATVASTDPTMIAIPPRIEVRYATMATDVVNRVPLGKGTVFPSDVGRLYFFTPIVGAQEDITITHYWYYRGRRFGVMPLKVTSAYFRTWSYVTIQPSWSGRMKVEAVGPDGRVLTTIRFTLKR